MKSDLYQILHGISLPGIATLSLLLLILVGFFHYYLPSDVSTSLFYFLPISMAAFFGGRFLGLLLAILSALVWFINDFYTGLVYSHAWVSIWNPIMRMLIFMLVAYLIYTLRTALEVEKVAADRDVLTGLSNRRGFNHAIQSEYSRSSRSGGYFSMAYLDVDNFKQVNDQWGHKEGDRLLMAIAQELTGAIRITDHVARLGGDEFVILMPQTDAVEVRAPIENCQKNLTLRMAMDSWPVTFSIGVVTFEQLPDDAEQTLILADRLMYEVKNGGKNRVLYSVWNQENAKNDVHSPRN